MTHYVNDVVQVIHFDIKPQNILLDGWRANEVRYIFCMSVRSKMLFVKGYQGAFSLHWV